MVIYTWSSKQIRVAESEKEVSEKIIRHALELELLISDFIRHPDQHRSEKQLIQKQESIELFISHASVSPENQENFDRLHHLFINLRKLYTNKSWMLPDSKTVGNRKFRKDDRTFDIMLLNTHQLVIEALAFRKKTAEKVKIVRSTTEIFLFLAAGGMTVLLSLTAFFLSRRVLTSINLLKTGSEIIGTGDLDFRIDAPRKDELGDLARSFNAMSEKLKEEVEKRRQKEAQILQQSKVVQMGEMITNISHHWRQPLNIIGLNVQEIKDARAFGELTTEYLNDIVEKTMVVLMRMSTTLDEFREFVAAQPEKSTFNIAENIEMVLEIMRPELESHFIQMNAQMDTSLEYFADKNLLGQVLYNIIHNAQEALIERRMNAKQVILTLQKISEGIQITISDTGGGIDDRIMERIFDPFFTTKDTSNKTGTGLYFAKYLVENELGGRIAVSNTDRGAIFSIVLPLK